MNSECVFNPLSSQPSAPARPIAVRTRMVLTAPILPALRRLAPWLAAALSAVPLGGCDGVSADIQRTLERRTAREKHPKVRFEALRVQPDAARNRVWAPHRDGVYVYETTTRRLVGRAVLPKWVVLGEPFNCSPDLALDRTGAAVVSSNVRTGLWRVDPERFEARLQELALDADRDKNVGFTGLAFVDGLLFGVDGVHGSLWRIDLATAQAKKIALSSLVQGACGLAGYPKAGSGRSLALCAAGHRGPRRIDLSPDLTRGEVTNRSCP